MVRSASSATRGKLAGFVGKAESVVEKPIGCREAVWMWSSSNNLHGCTCALSVTNYHPSYFALFPDVDLLNAFNHQRLYPPLLWGTTISPTSRPAYFQAMIRACYGTTEPPHSDVFCFAKVGQLRCIGPSLDASHEGVLWHANQ